MCDEKITGHGRYVVLSAPGQEEGAIPFVVFKSDYNLRAHAVKHFMNLVEWENGWRNNISMPVEQIGAVYDRLKKLNCPIVASDWGKSLSCYGCRLFDRECNQTGISEIYRFYLESVRKVLEETLSMPRYALFTSSLIDGGLQFCSFSRHAIAVKASAMEDNKTFNVMTAYRSLPPVWLFTEADMADMMVDGAGKSLFSGFLNKRVKEIKKEAEKFSIKWFTEETWGLETVSDHRNTKDDKTEDPSPRKPGRTPRHKAFSGKNWRHWDYDDGETDD